MKHIIIILMLIILNSPFALTKQKNSTNYFPLKIGNTWNYRYAEAESAFALPYKVFGTSSINDTLYFRFGDFEESPYLLRNDGFDKIIRRIGDRDLVWFDFTQDDSSLYEYKPFLNEPPYLVLVRKNVSIKTFLGKFENCIEFFFDDTTSFDDEQWYTFAPNLGMVRVQFASVNMLLASAIIDDKNIVNVDGKAPDLFNCSLNQNYPNPFNSRTKISYSIQNPARVSLKIFNVRGRVITTLVNEQQPKGNHEIIFDSVDLPSGLYLYQLKTEDFTQSRKFIIVK
jgi:hypothetical protein